MNNKKIIIFIIITVLVMGIATTFAYFTDTIDIDNLFSAAKYDTTADEVFTSPSNWKPGDTTQKEVTVTNKGDIDEKVRIALIEEWTDESGNKLPLISGNERVAIINFAENNKWKKSGEYYYYSDVLEPNQTTQNLIESITFNGNYNGEIECITSNDGHSKSCSSTGKGYDGGTYKLKVKIESVQANSYENAWITQTEINNPTQYVITFAPNGGKITEFTRVVTNGETYGTLPTPVYKANEEFQGWYLDSDYQTKIESTTTVNLTEDKILYAKVIGNNTLYKVLATAFDTTPTKVTKYLGAGAVNYANNVYYYKGAQDENYVIFGGYCWRMFRTTETGGVKMIYDGAPVDGKCENTREDQNGITGSWTTKNLGANYKYGTRFTIDDHGIFTLTGDTKTGVYSDSNYTNYQGLYTCMNEMGECTTMYHVNAHTTGSSSYVTQYTLGTIKYNEIGTSPYNADYISTSQVGYMYNTTYNYGTTAPSANAKFGSDVSYSNGIYTLSQVQNSLDNTHHYSCDNGENTCAEVRYYYYSGTPSDSLIYRYITLNGVANIDGALDEMLFASNVNTYDSDIKALVETWYENNLTAYTSKIEDTVYCNDRTIKTKNGWSPQGSLTGYLYFDTNSRTATLECANATDKFTVSNTKGNGKLSYPVGLLTEDERSLTYASSTNPFTTTRDWTWLASPTYVNWNDSGVRVVGASGAADSRDVSSSRGVRPVVSLKPGTEYISGEGTSTRPFIVE